MDFTGLADWVRGVHASIARASLVVPELLWMATTRMQGLAWHVVPSDAARSVRRRRVAFMTGGPTWLASAGIQEAAKGTTEAPREAHQWKAPSEAGWVRRACRPQGHARERWVLPLEGMRHRLGDPAVSGSTTFQRASGRVAGERPWGRGGGAQVAAARGTRRWYYLSTRHSTHLVPHAVQHAQLVAVEGNVAAYGWMLRSTRTAGSYGTTLLAGRHG